MIYHKNLETILQGLNEDLKWEYAAAIQYLQHAAMISGAQYFAIIDELNEHADEEFAHARVINELINYLGGVPTIQVETRYVSPDNIEMLRQDLQGEYDAITRYLERIRQLEDIGLYDSAQRIRKIVTEEQEHAMDLEVALDIERKTPTIPHTQQVYPVRSNTRWDH